MTDKEAIEILKEDPVWIHSIGGLVDSETGRLSNAMCEELRTMGVEVFEDNYGRLKVLEALGVLVSNNRVVLLMDSGNLPKHRYFRVDKIEGTPYLVTSDIKGFEELFDWSD